ncbi:glycosylphosphatidylinositol anchor biosynthesis [Coemansia sp. RSA 2607]|nr:glycosylphosphatidylinositol anchor biosynthesis [Coemansia sp. RSA 2607]
MAARLVEQHLFLALLLLRLGNVCLVQTFIHPDETWQSLEVAHRTVFGYGYITWEWRHALRGFAHPMLFAAVYRLLALLRLDDTALILAAPYVLVAVIAATVDYATFAFARRLAGNQVASWAVLCSALSWTMGSGIVRPLVNSAETALTAAAFVYWPWNRSLTRASLPTALALAALSCIIRPTSAALWLCAGLVLVIGQPRTNVISRTAYIVTTATVIGIAAVGLMLVIDHVGYGKWVFPPYQFYVFNVQQDLATWFGESPPFYHLYVSMPILFTSMLPFVLHGVYMSYRRHYASIEPAIVAVAASFVFSLVGHMEYRFLYPLLPIGFLYAGVSIHTLVDSSTNSELAKDKDKQQNKRGLWSVRNVVLYLAITNIPAMLYLDLVHQRGVVDVFGFLREQVDTGKVSSIGFLMPCHSTPFYSHLHKDIPMWFLSCEPPLERTLLDSHYWEANDFEQNPTLFLQKIFSPEEHEVKSVVQFTDNSQPLPGRPRQIPSHLVLYDGMARRVHAFLTDMGYNECARFFNTHFSGDSRREGDVVVYCKQ